MTTWPTSVERVAEFLRAAGGEARLEELPGDTATAVDAANAAGCELSQIVKSLLLLCDGAPVLALVPGDRRLDVEKARRAAGAATARLAKAEEVQQLTGFAPGSVAPFPLPAVPRVLIERTLLAHPAVWAGGGSSRHMVRLQPAELVRLARATPVDVVEEPEYHSQPDTDGTDGKEP
jgi:prolyl-tRNA editing enzyme YbaK/EbsC (Cys-tRNA(Pro) deacylase)